MLQSLFHFRFRMQCCLVYRLISKSIIIYIFVSILLIYWINSNIVENQSVGILVFTNRRGLAETSPSCAPAKLNFILSIIHNYFSFSTYKLLKKQFNEITKSYFTNKHKSNKILKHFNFVTENISGWGWGGCLDWEF